METSVFSQRLQAIKNEKQLTLKQLNQMTGISVSALSHYFSGANLPPLDIAIKLADTLGVSMDWLCGHENREVYKSEEGLDCAQVAIFFDRVVDSFLETSLDVIDTARGQCVCLCVYSDALCTYYEQKRSSDEYYRKLPAGMKDDFLPYKQAMESQLHEYLRKLSGEETGLRPRPDPDDVDEFPF